MKGKNNIAWEEIFQLIGHPIQLIKPDHTITHINDSTLTSLNIPKEEIIGKKCCELFHNSKKPPSNCPLESSLNMGKRTYEEVYVEALDKHFIIECTPLFDESGKVNQYIHIMTDVTQRIIAESELRKNLSHSRALFENAAVPISVEDFSEAKKFFDELKAKGVTDYAKYFTDNIDALKHAASLIKVREINIKLLELFGVNSLESFQNNCKNLFYEESWVGFKNKIIALANGETSFRGEISFITAKGKKKRIIVELSVHPDYHDSLEVVFVSFIDISKIKKFQEKLLSLNKRNNLIIETAIDGYMLANSKGEILDVNIAYCEMMGYSKEELLKMNIYDLDASHIIDEFKTNIEKIIEDGNARFETVGRHKNGDLLNVNISVSLFDFEGEKLSAIFIQNITERKEAIDKIKTQYQILNAIINSPSNLIIFSLDNNYRYTAFNQNHKIEMQNNWNAEIELGMDMLELIKTPEAYQEMKKIFDRALKGESFKEIQHQPTTDKYYELILNPILDEQHRVNGITAFVFDISKRRLTEQESNDYIQQMELMFKERSKELEKANFELKELDRLKSLFIASMSHELRTPLNSIIGFSGVLLMNMAGDLNEEQIKQLTFLQGSARHLLSLVNDIIDISKIEAGKIDIYKEEFDAVEVINEVVNSLEHFAKGKNLELKSNYPESLKIFGDKKRTKQILVNLVNNAVKFTEHGSVEITAEIQNKKVYFTVKDSGVGIKRSEMQKLFIPFSQITDGIIKKQEGTGLGLYLCQKLINLQNGSIWVESEYGHGSAFIFTLPTQNNGEK